LAATFAPSGERRARLDRDVTEGRRIVLTSQRLRPKEGEMRFHGRAVCLVVAGAVAFGSTAGKAWDDRRQGVIDARARLIRAMERNDIEGISQGGAMVTPPIVELTLSWPWSSRSLVASGR